MEAAFHNSKKIDSERMKGFIQRESGRTWLNFGIQFAIFLAACFGLAWYGLNDLAIFIPSVLAVAILSMSLFALGHECIHNTAFKQRWENQFVAFLVSVPIFYPVEMFRLFHFQHHRHTHEIGKDPEITMAGKPVDTVLSGLHIYIVWHTGLPLMLFKVFMSIFLSFPMPDAFWTKMLPYVNKNQRGKVARDARITFLVHAAVICLGIFWSPNVFWIYAALWLGHAMLAFYLVAEHNGLPHEGNIFSRTRSMRTSALVKWIMWNMPYHAEHHAYPAVPWHQLPAFSKALSGEVQHEGKYYPQLHFKALGSLLKGKPFLE